MDYETIYQKHANEYERLIAAEDADGQLLRSLTSIAPIQDARIVDVGTGTGRIMRMMATLAQAVIGVDRAPAMLHVAKAKTDSFSNCTLLEGDAGLLPVESNWADVVIAGWVFGHFRHWFPENWRITIGKAIHEMQRVAKPDATLILIETLGTGKEIPEPPNAMLAEYFSWLEGEKQFQKTSIRTDYVFRSVEEAIETLGFFFGDGLVQKIHENSWKRVPECTGIWVRRNLLSF